MGFAFSDQDLRSGSYSILNGPSTINVFNQVTAQNQSGQQDALNQDNTNAVFYNNYKNIVVQYHIELHNLNGTVSSDYADQTMIDAAKGVIGNLHFPTSPPWVNFNPKLIDTNLGNPTTFDSANELTAITQANADIGVLLSGFNDGGTSDTVDIGGWSGGTIPVTHGGFSSGQRIVVGSDTLALITGVAAGVPTGQVLTVTVLAGASSASAGATVVAARGGFNNSERSGGGTTSPSILAYFESFISADITVWDTALDNEVNALNANDATSPEDIQIAQANLDVASAQGAIIGWQTAVHPFADGPINAIQTTMTLRQGTQVPNRASQIITALGTITQESDGSFSGQGEYYNFFYWVNQRVSRSGGTLTKYYGYNLAINYSSNTKTNINQQLSGYAQHMTVAGFSDDANGTNQILVTSSVGFNIGDTIYIMDQTNLPTVPTTIIGIVNNDITVSAIISGFTATQSARIVKVF